MANESDRERTGPTDEVGSEGGSPGDFDLDKKHVITIGSEATSSVAGEVEEIEARDRQLTRDNRRAPPPGRPRR
jgi:hypothetical protein